MKKFAFYLIPGPEGWELHKEGSAGPILKSNQKEQEIIARIISGTQHGEGAEVLIYNEKGWLNKIFLHPQELYQEEFQKREDLLKLVGAFLKEVIKVPFAIYSKFFTYENVDELYQHLLTLLQLSPEWYANHFDRKLAEDIHSKDEILKRDNLVYLTGRYLEYNNLSSLFVFGLFYTYLDPLAFEDFYFDLGYMVQRKTAYVVPEENTEKDLLKVQKEIGCLPVYVVHEDGKKIAGWKCENSISDGAEHLVPLSGDDGKLAGWFDPTEGLMAN